MELESGDRSRISAQLAAAASLLDEDLLYPPTPPDDRVHPAAWAAEVPGTVDDVRRRSVDRTVGGHCAVLCDPEDRVEPAITCRLKAVLAQPMANRRGAPADRGSHLA
jgi:hypothetical protein